MQQKKWAFEVEGLEFAKCLILLEQFIQTVKGQNNFWQHNAFLTCSWRFFRLNELEQLKFKLEKKCGDLERVKDSLKPITEITPFEALLVK